MASVHKVSIYQQARDRIETDISGIIQCLNQKKESLFKEITVLENEFKSKQQQKLKSLKKLESLKARTEEELGDNLLSEIQGRLTQELQTGINKIRLETNSTVDYTIQIDWEDKLNVVGERIKEFNIKTVPNTVIYPFRFLNVSPSKKSPKKTKQYGYDRECNDLTAESQDDWTRWSDRNRGNNDWRDRFWKDENWADDNPGDSWD